MSIQSDIAKVRLERKGRREVFTRGNEPTDSCSKRKVFYLRSFLRKLQLMHIPLFNANGACKSQLDTVQILTSLLFYKKNKNYAKETQLITLNSYHFLHQIFSRRGSWAQRNGLQLVAVVTPPAFAQIYASALTAPGSICSSIFFAKKKEKMMPTFSITAQLMCIYHPRGVRAFVKRFGRAAGHWERPGATGCPPRQADRPQATRNMGGW